MPWPTNSRTTPKPCGLAHLLHGGGDVAEPAADLGLLDGRSSEASVTSSSLRSWRRRSADGVGDGAVGVEAIDDDAAVDGDDVAVVEDALGEGMPWTTSLLTEVQRTAGKPW